MRRLVPLLLVLLSAVALPAVLLAQATAPAPASGVPAILTLIVGTVISAVVVPVYTVLKNQWTWLNTEAPSWLHPIITGIGSVLIIQIAAHANVVLTAGDANGLTQASFASLFSAYANILLHELFKAKS